MGTPILSIRRGLSPSDQRYLQEQMPHVDRVCGSSGFRWFDLGKIACELLGGREYKRAFSDSHGGGRPTLDPGTAARSLRQHWAAYDSAYAKESGPLTVSPASVIFHASPRFYRIAYVLDSPELTEENRRLREFLDNQNGTEGDWQPYEPLLHVATIHEEYATGPEVVANWILDAFGDIAPESFTFERPKLTES